MNIDVNGNHTDYSFSRDGNTLKVVQKSNGATVFESTENYSVVFSDGSTIDLSQSFTTQAANATSVTFGTPSSTALADGGYVLVWEYFSSQEDLDDQEDGVTLQHYDKFGALLKETKLASGETEDPMVVAKSDGGYIVAWSSESGSSSTIQIQQFNAAGVAATKPQTIATSKTAELDDAVVSMLPDGRFVVTWTSSTGDDDDSSSEATGDIHSQLFNANGAKVGAAQKVSGTTVENTFADDQVILATSDGGFVIAYARQEKTFANGADVYKSTIEVRSYDANGAPKDQQPIVVHSVNGDYENASYHSLLKTDTGYLVTWVGLVDSGLGSYGRGLIAQHFDEEFQPVGDKLALTPGASSNANDASLTELTNGKYLVVWSTFEGDGNNSIYAQIRDADLTESGAVITVKSDSSGAYEPEVTVFENGEFLISWVNNNFSSGQSSSTLLSQRYDADGKPTGTATTIISADANNNTLTWTGPEAVTLEGKDGDDTFTGGAGNDTFDGGNGNDTVIASGALADSSFSLQNGELVLNGAGGKDTLISIEQVQFDDANITINDGTIALENSAAIVAETPATAALNDGSQVVAWKQGDNVMLQVFRDGKWEPASTTAINYDRGSLGVAPLGDGFIVTWGNYEAGTLFAQRYDAAGGTIGEPIQHSPVDTGRVIDDITATALKDGGFVMSWTEETPDLYVPGGPDGGEYLEGTGQAYVQLYATDGTAVGDPIALATGNLQAFEPSVSALQNGGFVVAWEYVNEAKESHEIYLQRFKADGSPDGKAIQVNTGTKGDQGDPEVVTLADGSYVVTWTRETDNDIKSKDDFGNINVQEVTTAIDIFMQRYSADGKKLGGEMPVNKESGFFNDPAITALKDGGYVISWATSDERDIYSGESKLFAQMYDKNGVKVGNELLIANSDDKDYFPSLSASADGGFVITWETSERYDSSKRDVFAKKFDANGNALTLTGDDTDNVLTWTGNAGATLEGGDGDDTLTGGDGNDALVGGAGNDRLDGQGGSNLLIGGAGDDTYVVRSIRDKIEEQADGGIDTVESSITWTLGSHLENLTLTGNAAINGIGNELDNSLVGNAAKNTLNGGAGNDTLDGGAGVDTLLGGIGDDTYIVDLLAKGAGAKATVALEDSITEKNGQGDHDKLVLRISDEVRAKLATATTATSLTLGANLEELDASQTGELKLNLTGNAADNVLLGNDADNLLNGGTGIDTLIGGKGNDTYVLDNAAELERINVYQGVVQQDDGNDTVRVAFKGGTALNPTLIDLSSASANLAEVENVQITGAGVFHVTGNDLNNTLDSGKTANTLSGGLGDDTYIITHKDTKVIEQAGEGIDTIVAAFSADLNNYANVENLTLSGKAAINATGDSEDNTLTGNDGANILDGGAGADRLVGGKGNDTYIVDDLGDVVIENAGEGIDTIKASISFDLNNAENVENLILTGTEDLNATGNDLANTLTGNDGANWLDGGAGIDKLIGGKGDDTYTVDLIAKGTGGKATVALQDTIIEAKGGGDHDTLILRIDAEVQEKLADATTATTLTLANYLENLDASHTGELKLNLTGNAADNVIIGNAANNIIIGGLGSDTLTGGGGADTFRFNSLKELGLDSTQDVITDFSSIEGDTIDLKFLKGWSFNGAGEENQATGAKQLWAVAYEEENGETGMILYGNNGGTNDADFSIKLVGVTELSQEDLVLS